MNIRIFKTAVVTIIFSATFSVLYGQVSQKAKDDHKRKWDTPAWTDTLQNPYANNVAATDSGKALYLKICSVCHGAKGKGDGIAAAGLSVLPADHTSDLIQMQTDGSLFYEMSNGHAPMPAYKMVLTDKQRWGLINYIRTLKPKNSPPKQHKS